MNQLTLFLGESTADESLSELLEVWSSKSATVTLDCRSIHDDPAAAVRLGITELPALVLQDEIIAQGTPETWLVRLLDRVFAPPEPAATTPGDEYANQVHLTG